MKLSSLQTLGATPVPTSSGGGWFGAQPSAQDLATRDLGRIGQDLASLLDAAGGNEQGATGGGQDDYLALALASLLEDAVDGSQATPDDVSDAVPPGSGNDARTPQGLEDGADDDRDDLTPSAGEAQLQTDATPSAPSDATTAATSSPGSAPAASQAVQTGTGTGQSYTVQNDTGREQDFLFSDAAGHTAVMDLKAGQSGTFIGGDDDPGIRIQTSGPQGQTRSPANEALFEAGSQTVGGRAVNNPDVSDVDGNLSYDGQGTDIEITSSTGQQVGNATGDAYRNWNDDTESGPSNPMTMAQTTADSFTITFTNSSETLATPGNR